MPTERQAEREPRPGADAGASKRRPKRELRQRSRDDGAAAAEAEAAEAGQPHGTDADQRQPRSTNRLARAGPPGRPAPSACSPAPRSGTSPPNSAPPCSPAPPATLADAEDIADRQAAGQAFTVFPPAWTPAVSRLTTDGALLTAALVAGREAVNILFDE